MLTFYDVVDVVYDYRQVLRRSIKRQLIHNIPLAFGAIPLRAATSTQDSRRILSGFSQDSCHPLRDSSAPLQSV